MSKTTIYGVAGVVLLVAVLDTEPRWGGWLLLLTVLGLLLSPKARAILSTG